MIYIFRTTNKDEIQKIKSGYFNENSERHRVPLLIHPDEGLDMDEYSEMAQSLIDKIIEDDNSVVICYHENFSDVLKLAIGTRRASIAGKRLRKVVANFGVSLDECSKVLSAISHTARKECEEIKDRLAGIGIIADDDAAAGANCHWQDVLDILSSGRDHMRSGLESVGVIPENKNQSEMTFAEALLEHHEKMNCIRYRFEAVGVKLPNSGIEQIDNAWEKRSVPELEYLYRLYLAGHFFETPELTFVEAFAKLMPSRSPATPRQTRRKSREQCLPRQNRPTQSRQLQRRRL